MTEKMVKLKDGTDIIIRGLKKDDLEQSYSFFRDLPAEDRAYLRVDVTRRDLVEKRINAIDSGRVFRIVAIADNRIVADGALELEDPDWEKHIAEIRLIVARPFQGKGLGTLMAGELYMLAAGKRVEEIIVKIMGPQRKALSIFEKLGFHREAFLHDYVKDIEGHKQDLIIMRCDLESLWKKLGDYISHFDWQRTR